MPCCGAISYVGTRVPFDTHSLSPFGNRLRVSGLHMDTNVQGATHRRAAFAWGNGRWNGRKRKMEESQKRCVSLCQVIDEFACRWSAAGA